jgi:hypothetical protein
MKATGEVEDLVNQLEREGIGATGEDWMVILKIHCIEKALSNPSLHCLSTSSMHYISCTLCVKTTPWIQLTPHAC